MTLSRRQRLQAAAIAAIGTPILEALGATYRWREAGMRTLERLARDGRQPIFAFWHGRILAATLYFRDRGIVVITSENFDGEWISRVIRRFGYDTARGSSSRGGARALVQMRRDMRAGCPTAFTVDGPRGPARIAQPGAVWLASATGSPIVPFHIEAGSFWTVKSWDRHQVPKPGSDLAIAIGDPIEVAARASETDIEEGRQALERALGRLEHQTIAMLGTSDGH
ncbi:MAG: lysophospholipid acyltransferase family protein [Acidobacteria bacterium]|nr:lysophospholipid acyltransferase family protein [Acidobacteriota bacterium]